MHDSLQVLNCYVRKSFSYTFFYICNWLALYYFEQLGKSKPECCSCYTLKYRQEYKTDGVKLDNEFWAVRVDAMLAKYDLLIWQLKKALKVIGQATKLIITWPTTFLCCSSKFYCSINLILSNGSLLISFLYCCRLPFTEGSRTGLRTSR